MARSSLPFVVVAGVVLASAGCSQTDAVVGTSPPVYRPVVLSELEPIDALDLLFVIDDSGSMADDQAALVAAARTSLFPQLASLPYGLPDLHVGVVSTSFGAGGAASVPGCPNLASGGALLMRPGGECAGITDAFLEDRPAPDGTRSRNYTGTLEDAFSCMADLGANGCGFEQPLAALRRALDPTNLANAGFLRPEALLLVVIVSDEDDCSVLNGDLFGDPAATVASPLGPRTSFRCFEFGVVCDEPEDRTAGARTGCRPQVASDYVSALQPMVDAVVAAKGGDRSKVMVTGVFGGEDPVQVVLADQGAGASPLLASQCALPTGITAYPAVRLNAFAREFPARFLLPGVCNAGMARVVANIGAAATDVLAGGTCLLGTPRQPLACRAQAVAIGGAARPLRVCAGAGCVEIAPSAECAGTEHHLRASVEPSLIAPGERLEVDCAVDP